MCLNWGELTKMATVGVPAHGEGMSVGRVYSRAFGTLAHNPVAVLGLALLLGALPGLLVTWLVQSTQLTDASQASPQLAIGSVAIGLLSYLAMLILSSIVHGALTRATVAESQGRRASIGECLSAALPVALPLVGLVILWSLGIMVGFLFLIVPAIILMCMWAVAVPVMVEERVGIGTAFGRSRALTKGNRWKVFGVLLILLVANYLLLAVFAVILGMAAITGPASTGSLTIGYSIMSLVTGTLFSAVWGTLAPSMYVDLRNVKEGGSMGDLSQVFA